ncbi:MAG TPA: ATP-binding protein [Candidatus Limnocylindrales bacterium]|nr:ATP-binding protein [Candidatus Limnocylindrales bacterium]
MDEALRALRDPRTYRRILYLVLAFPLGTLYFIIIVTGVSTGMALSIVVGGVFVLAITMLTWLALARMERALAVGLLGAKIRPFSLPDPPGQPFWMGIRNRLTDAVTWKSLAFLLAEFPFGILSFTAVVTLLSISVALTLVPVVYLVALAIPSANIQITLGFGSLLTGPSFGRGFLLTLLLSAVGIGLTVVSLWLLSGLGWLWARFAEAMLGVSETRLQLAAAQAEARTQQARAEQSDHSRRELIVNASHELRTPVASISAHVESLLKPDRPLDEETRKYLSVVAAETERLGSLVEDVLALARADADELHLDIQPVDVPAIVDQVCEALAPLARRERNLSLVHSSAPSLPRALADRDRLAQVLTNLVRNAVNHTPDGGIISVVSEANGEQVQVIVSDTGIGIAAQDLSRIFDRFYRADPSRARDTGGSGLGLAIVRDLVTAMGGSITAQSTPGHGSVFRIALQLETP